MKLGRCADCPSDVDVELLDRLRTGAAPRPSEQQVPAYVVFTDATLTAIAEHRPADDAGAGRHPGHRRAQAGRYGAGACSALIDDPDDRRSSRKFSVIQLCGRGPRPTVVT